MLFLYYPRCSTCIKAKKWLDDKGIIYKSRDIVNENPTEDELVEIIRNSGYEIKKFFNTSGLKYKELKLKDKLKNMDDYEKIKLLATDGKLVKRPILITKDKILVGFKLEQWEEWYASYII